MDPDLAELQRRLDIRTAELAAAQRRIEELLGKIRDLNESKRKLTAAREERDALRASLEYRFGRALFGPFGKLARHLARRHTEPVEDRRDAGSYHRRVLQARPSARDLEAMRNAAAELESPALFSIVMIVRDPPLAVLEEAISSVRAQAYPHWELVLVDNASDDSRVAARLRELAAGESRIRTRRLPEKTGPAQAASAGLEMATGDFVGIMDQNDWLEPDALFAIARPLSETPEADIVYSDEDQIDEAGRFCEPVFKPDWSPDALLSGNYLGRFAVLRRGLLETLGGIRAGFEGAQEYDLFLRATEQARRILHVPKTLYHRRVAVASPDPAAAESGAKALNEALIRRGINAEVVNEGPGAQYRVRRAIVEPVKIALIIPTRDRVELLKRCIESISARTSYPNYKIVIADNESQDAATLEYYDKLPHRILRYPGPFNYAAINNYAVRQTDAPWILFLNNDTEVINADWLTSMAEHIQRPEVGAVGAKLLYPDDTIQHAGVILSEQGTALHAYGHAPSGTMENGGRAQLISNYSAVTAACMLTRRECFEQVGGFDELELPVSYNDVDYCLKLRRAGYLIVYTPYARLYHYESASRGRGKSDPAAGRLIRQRWPDVIAHDPYSPER